MADVDPKERQAFEELQNRLVQGSIKRKALAQQTASTHTAGRRAALTAEELAPLPEGVKAYQPVGRAYFLVPKAQLVAELRADAQAAAVELKALEASRAAVDKGLKEAEGELRELLQSSPALQALVAAQP